MHFKPMVWHDPILFRWTCHSPADQLQTDRIPSVSTNQKDRGAYPFKPELLQRYQSYTLTAPLSSTQSPDQALE
jgi:hypothetical protein